MLITDIVDTERYPLHLPDHPRRIELIDTCRSALQRHLYCSIPGLVKPQALAAMAQEAKALQAVAYHNNSLRNCYLHQKLDATLPDDHPRNLQDRSSTRMIAYDQLGADSPLKVFYHAPAVRDTVAAIVGEGALFDNVDPYQPANYVCYREGDESSWHFDADNSFTMTLMIQAADQGGIFEMSPNSRTQQNENYEHVGDVLRGKHNDSVVAVGREPGELCIFRGCHSLHRVTPVEGDTLRIMGVFVYEFQPGIAGDPEVNATIYGSRVSSLRS